MVYQENRVVVARWARKDLQVILASMASRDERVCEAKKNGNMVN
jgi:hypothetical protein